jgi:hypothetical protein
VYKYSIAHMTLYFYDSTNVLVSIIQVMSFWCPLAILTPTDGGPSERPVTLGQLIGRIKNGSAGTAALAGFKEDRRNAAKSVHPLYYGAFSSYGPAYDSTFANLTKQVAGQFGGWGLTGGKFHRVVAR